MNRVTKPAKVLQNLNKGKIYNQKPEPEKSRRNSHRRVSVTLTDMDNFEKYNHRSTAKTSIEQILVESNTQ
jgi:hypothetical protein